MAGSKIDWRRVRGSVNENVGEASGDEYVRAGCDFWARAFKEAEIRFDAEVVIFGDSAVEGALHLRAGEVELCLPTFLLLPQHTYIVELQGDWCADFTLERDFGFGRAMV